MTNGPGSEVSQGRPADNRGLQHGPGTVLLTGATGQIGSRVRQALMSTQGRLICLTGIDSPTPVQDESWIHWGYDKSLEPPELGGPIHVVIHLGAQTSAHVARRSPRRDLLHNVVRFVSLLESLVERGQRPFVVLAGTATQAGALASYLGGDTPDAPETFYDVSKTASELYLEQFMRESWLSGVTLKFSNVYGAIPGLQDDRSLLTRVMSRALQGESIDIYDGCDGHRDYLHVQDVAEAIISAVNRQPHLKSASYWVGSGQSMRLSEAISKIIDVAHQLTGRRSEIRLIPAPKDLYRIDERDVHVDSLSFREDSLWSPQVPFEKGARELGLSLLSGRH